MDFYRFILHYCYNWERNSRIRLYAVIAMTNLYRFGRIKLLYMLSIVLTLIFFKKAWLVTEPFGGPCSWAQRLVGAAWIIILISLTIHDIFQWKNKRLLFYNCKSVYLWVIVGFACDPGPAKTMIGKVVIFSFRGQMMARNTTDRSRGSERCSARKPLILKGRFEKCVLRNII